MKINIRFRLVLMALILTVMMGALVWQLGTLTLAEGEAYAEAANSRSTRTITTTGARGRILDRNGIPLAYDSTSYNVLFTRDPERRDDNSSALYTEALLRAIEMIEAGGGKTIDTCYIKMNENGEIVYDWGNTENETLIQARYKNLLDAISLSYDDTKPMEEWPSAKEAYLKMRTIWKVPEDLDFATARKVLSIRQEVNLNQWRAYEPITIAYNVPMEVVAQLDMLSGELMGITTEKSTSRVYPWGTTAAHVLGYLSRQVTDEATEDYMSRLGYTPADYQTIENIYATDKEGNLKTNENGITPLVQMTRMGYSYNDYIGVEGVERTMEKYLTASTAGRRGTRTVEVNKVGVIKRELEKETASNGNDVMLTLDLPLQQVVENALQTSIDYIRAYEEQKLMDELEDYEKIRADTSTIKMAESGSIVVMEVKTGKVLAMASSPGYNPNDFIAGLTPEQSDALFKNTSMPTMNRAIASRLAPGSIYKMATGLAGLMEGVITTETRLSDGKTHRLTHGVLSPTSESTEENRYTNFIRKADNEHLSEDELKISAKDAPKCWISARNVSEHHNINLSQALTVSCNYYFCAVADAIGIDKLNQWSTRLGLNDKTNIELPGELNSHIGGQQVLYDNTLSLNQQKSSLPAYVYRAIKEYLREIMDTANREASDEAIERCAERLLALQDGGTQEYGEAIRQILSEELRLPVTLTRSQQAWVSRISSMLTELQWKPAMTIRSGFGQGISLVTPIAIARYAATFGNGGTVYDAHIVDRVIDENGSVIKVFEPTVHDQIDAPDSYWESIREGLRGVVSPEDRGTAAGNFSDEFKEHYQSRIIGKSGTAQIRASNNVDIENTSWFITLLPREDPEIVVVTCIPYGLSGSRGSKEAVEMIVRFYLDRKDGAAKENLVDINGLIP